MPSAVSLGIVIVASVVYHLVQKTSTAASPWSMLAIAYGVAFAASLALAIGEGAWPTRGVTAGGLLVGLSALGIEAGVFFIYRSGWPLATASVIASVTVTALLALIGVVVLGETMTLERATGVVLAAVAATLIAKGAR